MQLKFVEMTGSSDVHMTYDFDINGAQRMSQPGGLVVPSMAIHNHQLECLQKSYPLVI